MCHSLTWKERRNQKVQAEFDAKQKKRKSHLVRTICNVVYIRYGEHECPEGLIDELVEAVLKLDD
jgi:hypothetical protein